MENILIIVKSLEDSRLLLEFSETIKNEAKEQKGGFVTLGAIRHIRCKSIRKYVSRQRSYKSRRRNS